MSALSSCSSSKPFPVATEMQETGEKGGWSQDRKEKVGPWALTLPSGKCNHMGFVPKVDKNSL